VSETDNNDSAGWKVGDDLLRDLPEPGGRLVIRMRREGAGDAAIREAIRLRARQGTYDPKRPSTPEQLDDVLIRASTGSLQSTSRLTNVSSPFGPAKHEAVELALLWQEVLRELKRRDAGNAAARQAGFEAALDAELEAGKSAGDTDDAAPTRPTSAEELATLMIAEQYRRRAAQATRSVGLGARPVG